MMDDSEFARRLLKTYEVKADLEAIRSGERAIDEGEQERVERQLEMLRADVRIARLIDAEELRGLFSEMKKFDPERLADHFRLTQSVS
jgi:hypothetical protein